MRTWIFKHPHEQRRILKWGLAVWAACAMAVWTAAAEPASEPDPGGPAPRPDAIHIEGDRLVITQTPGRSAEWIGHVRVEQGDTTIVSDRLKLFFKNDGEPSGGAVGGPASGGVNAESIDRIEAIGNVRIALDNRIARGERAVYTTSDRKLVLSGPGARVTSGQDVVEGNLITFYRDSGRVEMVGGEDSPVKMIIRSQQRGLN